MNTADYYVTPQTRNGLDYLLIHSPFCDAEIFMQGAHISHFAPKGKPDLLWLSPTEPFVSGQALRGGIPVCWPWFGNTGPAGSAAHGFARTALWQVSSMEWQAPVLKVVMTLDVAQFRPPCWPHHAQLQLIAEFSEQLRVSLITTNTGTSSFELSEALHSYLAIGDIQQTEVNGLAGHYVEFGQQYDATDSVTISQETDRVYLDVPMQQSIHCPRGTMLVSRKHSNSMVLWNPWQAKAEKLSAFPDDGYQHMLCVEASHALSDSRTLAPGQTSQLTTTLAWLE